MDNNEDQLNKTILSQTSQEEGRKERKLVYTNIHTYSKKRQDKKNSKTTNVIFYNKNSHLTLQEYALHNDTDVSSIISNVVDDLVRGLDEKPNTLEPFIDPDYVPTPEIMESIDKIVNFLEKQDVGNLKKLEEKFYHAYVYCVAFSQMEKEDRKEMKNQYIFLYQKYIKN